MNALKKFFTASLCLCLCTSVQAASLLKLSMSKGDMKKAEHDLADKAVYSTEEFIQAQRCIEHGLLLRAAFRVSTQTLNNKGDSTAVYAIRHQNMELLQSMAHCARDKEKILQTITAEKQFPFLLRYLKENPDAIPYCPDCAIFGALASENADTFRELLRLTGKINIVNDKGISLLRVAFQQNKGEHIKYMLQMQADVNAGQGDDTPLLCALYEQNKEITELLLQAGADVNQGKSTSPLIEAITNQDAELVQQLIKLGADVNCSRDTTPLLAAIKVENVEIIQALLQAGVDLKTEKKNNPLEAAVRQGNLVIVRLLIDKGAAFPQNSSLLLTALKSSHADIAAYLLSHGAEKELYEEGSPVAEYVFHLDSCPSTMNAIISEIKEKINRQYQQKVARITAQQKKEESLAKSRQQQHAQTEAQQKNEESPAKSRRQQQAQTKAQQGQQKQAEATRKREDILSNLAYITDSRPRWDANFYAFIHLPASRNNPSNVIYVCEQLSALLPRYARSNIQIILVCYDDNGEEALTAPREHSELMSNVPVILAKDSGFLAPQIMPRFPGLTETTVTIVDSNFSIAAARNSYEQGMRACKEMSFIAFKGISSISGTAPNATQKNYPFTGRQRK